jgi:tetratricopeptide (TPR) repeat protein
MRARSLAAIGVVAILAVGCSQPAASRSIKPVALLGSVSGLDTSRASLDETVRKAEAALATTPTDAASAVRLADALMRQARVLGNPGLAIRAEKALRLVLNADPQRYDARRMLATVLLSQHRFREAIAEAQRCQQVRPTDGWLYGVAGDAHLELGEYEEAFAAFGRMDALHPDAASYARLSYARELQGDLAGAVAAMTMALEATSPSDPESQAWHHAQLGHLRLAQDRSAEAAREFEHALYIFPDHPLAIEGLVRVASRQGRHDDAVALAERLIAQAPSPAALALSADELRAVGRTAEATRRDALAEAAWRTDAPEPARLALFLAQRGDKEKIDEAVRLAETAARERNDIFTNDALAWAYFKAGRLEDAARASARALRTGTVDRDLRARAAVIAHADALGAR